MELKFFGAARQVTGSMHYLETSGGYRVLIDCGVDYELQRSFTNYQFFEFPFQPGSLDCVILTHAHIDHSGNLPYLFKSGYKGQILCTEATAKLAKLLLNDSFNIMEGEWNQRFGKSKKKRPELPYTQKHIKKVCDSMVTINYNQEFMLNEQVRFTFQQAGHILGAASVSVTVNESGVESKVGFTGDLGNYDSKLVVDPTPFRDHKYIVTESTYGARLHSGEDPKEELLKYMNKACVEENGKLVIPAFSVGRSHAIAFTFAQLFSEGRLPEGIPIYIDSPLSFACAQLYQEYENELNDEARAFFRKHGVLFEEGPIQFISTREASDALSYTNERCVIISAAGMVEGGRIQKHIRENISNPKSQILIAGYCAPGTLGYKLLQGQPTVSINYREYAVYAGINRTDAFSAHPDQTGLLRFLKECSGPHLEHIFLVHGEHDFMRVFSNELKRHLTCEIHIPKKGDAFEV